MANNVRGNIIYCDTAANFDDIRELHMLILTPTSATAQCIIKDRVTGGNAAILDLRHNSAGNTIFFNFDQHTLYFPSGLEVDTLTDCIIMMIVGRQ